MTKSTLGRTTVRAEGYDFRAPKLWAFVLLLGACTAETSEPSVDGEASAIRNESCEKAVAACRSEARTQFTQCEQRKGYRCDQALADYLRRCGEAERACRNDSTFSLKSAVQILPDLSVKTPYAVHRSLGEYFASPEFRDDPLHRCAVRADRVRQSTFAAPGLWPLAAPGDCDADTFDPDDEYDIGDNDDEYILMPVVVHVASRTNHVGEVSDSQVEELIDAMNQDFDSAAAGPFGTNIQFALAGITRHVSNDWFDNACPTDDGSTDAALDFEADAGWETDRYLNIYVVGGCGGLGWASFPFPIDAGGGAEVEGVTLSFGVLDDLGGAGPYNLGKTASHEVGHYLGLFHTFNPNDANSPVTPGTCEDDHPLSDGDLIPDTEPEAYATYGCPGVNPMSCGVADNIHNIMNYSDDECLDELTFHQSLRMVCGWTNYRDDVGHQLHLDDSRSARLCTSSAEDGCAINEVSHIGGVVHIDGTTTSLVPGRQFVWSAAPLRNATGTNGASQVADEVEIRLGVRYPDGDIETVAESTSNASRAARIEYTIPDDIVSLVVTSVRGTNGGFVPHLTYRSVGLVTD